MAKTEVVSMSMEQVVSRLTELKAEYLRVKATRSTFTADDTETISDEVLQTELRLLRLQEQLLEEGNLLFLRYQELRNTRSK